MRKAGTEELKYYQALACWSLADSIANERFDLPPDLRKKAMVFRKVLNDRGWKLNQEYEKWLKIE